MQSFLYMKSFAMPCISHTLILAIHALQTVLLTTSPTAVIDLIAFAFVLGLFSELLIAHLVLLTFG